MFTTRHRSISRTNFMDGRRIQFFLNTAEFHFSNGTHERNEESIIVKSRPRSISRKAIFSNWPHGQKAELIFVKSTTFLHFLNGPHGRKTETSFYSKNDLAQLFERTFSRTNFMNETRSQYFFNICPTSISRTELFSKIPHGRKTGPIFFEITT